MKKKQFIVTVFENSNVKAKHIKESLERVDGNTKLQLLPQGKWLYTKVVVSEVVENKDGYLFNEKSAALTKGMAKKIQELESTLADLNYEIANVWERVYRMEYH